MTRSDDEAAFARVRHAMEQRILSALASGWSRRPQAVRAELGVTARDTLFVAAVRHLKATGKINCYGVGRGLTWRRT